MSLVDQILAILEAYRLMWWLFAGIAVTIFIVWRQERGERQRAARQAAAREAAIAAERQACDGTLIWYDVPECGMHEPAALLVCSACGTVSVSGAPLDPAHMLADILREGVA